MTFNPTKKVSGGGTKSSGFTPVQKVDDMTWYRAFEEGVKSSPGATWQMLKDIGTIATSPIKTAETMGQIAAGGVEKLIPGKQPDEEKWDQFVGMIKERYGSIKNLKKTISADLPGVAGDVASIVSGGGGLIRGAGNVGRMSRVAQVGKTVQRAGAAMEPLTVMGKGLGKLIPADAPAKLMWQAVKPSTTAAKYKKGISTLDYNMAQMKTMLDYKLKPNIKGYYKLVDEMNKTWEVVEDLMNKAPDDAISSKVLISKFPELKAAARKSPTGIEDLKVINSIEEQIRDLNSMSVGSGKSKTNIWAGLTPQELLERKQIVYKKLNNYYMKNINAPIASDVVASVGQAAMEKLESIIPEIKQANAKWGELKELRDIFEQKASRIMNTELFGLSPTSKALAGGVVGSALGDPTGGITTGAILGLLDNPRVKPTVALVLDKLRKEGIRVSPTRTAIELGFFQSGRATRELESDPLGLLQ